MDDGQSGRSEYEQCPEILLESAKAFLSAGKGDAARASCLAILEEYPACPDAHFGLVLSDQLRFMRIIDKLLSHIFDPFGPYANGQEIDVGAIVVDYAENLLEPIVHEMLEHLEYCRNTDTFRFELDRLPFEILGLDFLVYAGEYDAGDVLLQSAEFNLIAAGLDTILSGDLGFDFQIVIDHMEAWEGMELLDIIIDVVDMILEILLDPAHPDFLRLREDGLWRMPRAGLEMGYAFDLLHEAVDVIRTEPQDQDHDVTGCGDRNANGLCDPDEFIHGLFYSLPSDLHEQLQEVELALRDSYWDGTELDSEPGIPNPFILADLNPILQYFDLPGIIPSLAIDFGAMYAQPDPDGIRKPFAMVCILLRLILDLIHREDVGLPDNGTPEICSGYDKGFSQADGVPQGPPAVGLETVTDIAALPYILPTARTKQFSAHDPTGGNDDGFTPPNHLYIDEHGEYVVFDSFGPGCIYRFQFTHTWSCITNLRIYVDDMEVPVFEGPFWMIFFLSAFEPFSKPLIGSMFSASGTNFSYLPIPFEKRCKITYNVPPEFFSITYVSYDADTSVTSFTGDENDSELRTKFRNPGTDPKPDVPSFTVSGSSVADAGGTVEVVSLTDPGAIWQLFIEVEPFTQEAVEDLWLLAWWDGEETPAIEAPMNEFFGSRFIEDAPKAFLMGHDCRRFYCYFPMPFRQEAVIVLENRGVLTVDVSWDVVVTLDSYADRAGHFKAIHNEENPVAVGRDYRIGLRRERAGKWVGLTHTMRGSPARWYLEGDERYYVDGSASPALYGTGTEDYYNGGWYFLWGPFTEPLCGNPTHRTFPGFDLTGAYRLHIGDAVHYLDAVRLGIEHGADNSGTYDHYSSVAYFYELDRPALRLSDTLDIGDEADESAHDYRAIDSEIIGEITSFYEGEDDEIPVTDAGRVVKGEGRFRIEIDPENEGIVLRRRFDQFFPCQRARVMVNGIEVGTWYMPENSMFMRWAEDDFVLPPSSTSGRSNVEILIQPEGETDWTEFFYWVYSIVP